MRGQLWLRPQADAAMLHIGTADVELVSLHDLGAVQLLHDFHIIFLCRTGHVGDDLRIELCQPWQLSFHDHLDARVLQADGVEHAHRRFGDTRSRIAKARLRRSALDGDAAQQAEIIQLGEFAPEAETAAGRNDRVLQVQSWKLNTQIHQNSTFPIGNTGPSLQMR